MNSEHIISKKSKIKEMKIFISKHPEKIKK